MFIGHYALALASKKNSQVPSLAILFIAVQLLDLLWPIFVLLGLETIKTIVKTEMENPYQLLVLLIVYL